MENKDRIAGLLELSLVLMVSLLVLGGLVGLLAQGAWAAPAAPEYGVVGLEDVPAYGRSAPYGQWLVTHNGVSITTTENLGTVARTNGYDKLKAIMCNVGAYDVTANLYARTSSTGDVYAITTGLSFPANTNTIITVTEIAPWMSLGLTSEVTGSTTTCGIYVQTP